jgi:hypothetical protein
MPPAGSGGGAGTADFWANIDRQYDADFRHHLRMSRLHQRNMSFAAQQFQSQMMALMLLGESEAVLEQVGGLPPMPDPPTPNGSTEAPAPDPSQTP